MTNLTHNSFLCLFQLSTRFEQPRAHHQENQLYQYNMWYMSPTQSDIHQMLYWYNWFSWWWARGCSKHVESWNKHIKKNCTSSWSFTKNHNKMHGQQNIKSCDTTVAVSSCSLSNERVGLSITDQSLSTVHTLLQTVCVQWHDNCSLQQYSLHAWIPSVQTLCCWVCRKLLSFKLWRHSATGKVIRLGAVMFIPHVLPVSSHILLLGWVTSLATQSSYYRRVCHCRPQKHAQGPKSINDSLHSLAGRFMAILSRGK
jgi:hypothetical protein